MKRIDLSGEWTFRKAGAKKGLPAAVPGSVHTDLLAAREAEDPVVRRNLEGLSWTAACEWVYERLFVADELSGSDAVVLRFDGASGCAAVSLNEKPLGRIANPFEAVEFDVRALLKPGKNKVSVTFAAAAGSSQEGARGQASARGAAGLPVVVSAGLWRGVSLSGYSAVRVCDVRVSQDFSQAGVVGLGVTVGSERLGQELPLEVCVRVAYKGSVLQEARAALAPPQQELRLAVRNPQLWWPAGLGEQPLYEVTVDVLSGRTCLEHVSRRIGLRQVGVECAKESGRTVLRLSVNRHPFFMKGASWLPADLYMARVTRVEYARLVKAAVVASMNILRVWGGGVYESDAFYDLCDEYGICVWQDLMVTGEQAGAPTPAALAGFEREAGQAVRRLRHHPSLVLWCGGDGGGGGVPAEYERTAGRLVAASDPERAYVPALPHQPFSAGGEAVFEPLPSFPEPRVAAGYLGEGERNVAHPVCAFHVTPADGLERLYRGFLSHFLMPAGFENTLWLSQIQQGWAFKRQFERARTGEACPGLIYWHLNDVWPCCSPSSVDAGGRWKGLHYMVRRFFSPLWLCGRPSPEAGGVEVYVFNDGLKAFKGELQWRLTEMEGAVVAEGAKKVLLKAASREKALGLKTDEAVRKRGGGNLVLWLYLLDEQGNQVAWNFQLFCEPRELLLRPPRMRAEIRNWDDNSFLVTLTSHCPAMWVWLSLEGVEARYDDNFFCMEPEKPFRIRVTPAVRMKLDSFRQHLRIGSLRDTWQEKRSLMQMMAVQKK